MLLTTPDKADVWINSVHRVDVFSKLAFQAQCWTLDGPITSELPGLLPGSSCPGRSATLLAHLMCGACAVFAVSGQKPAGGCWAQETHYGSFSIA